MPSNTSGGAVTANDGGGGKKSKSKKGHIEPATDAEAIQARISELEKNAAGEENQAAEIEREAKKAHKALTSQVNQVEATKRVEFLLKKSSELLAEMKRVETENKKLKKKSETVQKERDKIRQDLNKATGLRGTLEGLCRQLQKDNNQLKADKKALNDHVQTATTGADDRAYGLLAKLDSNETEMPDKGINVGSDADILGQVRTQFQSFVDQYELRELHFQSQMRVKEREVNLHRARHEEERKKLQKEMAKRSELEKQLAESRESEKNFEQQLDDYVKKFKQVEDTLNNSNELFLTFRQEMEDMSRKTRRLDKDNETMRRKHEAKDANIYRMAEEVKQLRKGREKLEKDLETENRIRTKCEDIIRGMQSQGRVVTPAAAMASTAARTGRTHRPPEDKGEEDPDDDEDDDEDDEDEDDEDEDEDDDDTDDTDDARPIKRPGQPEPGTGKRPLRQQRPALSQPPTNGH